MFTILHISLSVVGPEFYGKFMRTAIITTGPCGVVPGKTQVCIQTLSMPRKVRIKQYRNIAKKILNELFEY